MRLTVGQLRRLVREAIHLHPGEGGEWRVASRPRSLSHVDSPAISIPTPSRGKMGYEAFGTWAVGKVEDLFPIDYIKDNVVPEDVTPDEMLEVLKTGKPVTAESGETLVPEPGLQEAVVRQVATYAAQHLKSKGLRPDIITNPESSSVLATMFGMQLAQDLGAEFVKFGLLKQKDPKKLGMTIPPGLTPAQEREMRRALERAQEQIAQTGTFSLRHSFHAKDRKLVKNFLEPSDELYQRALDSIRPQRILFVDDVVTTASTHNEAKRVLLDLGFEVVGNVAMFKQPTPAPQTKKRRKEREQRLAARRAASQQPKQEE